MKKPDPDLDLTPYRPRPHAPMVTGKAIGGPRDGIKLTASQTWDGIVMIDLVRAHKGKYTWDGKNWTWQVESNDGDGSSHPRGPAHHKRRKNSLAY